MSEEDDTLHCTLWGASGQSAIRNPHPHREDRSASPDLLIVEILDSALTRALILASDVADGA